MIRKIVICLFFILCFVDVSFSANVTDDASGNKGYILVNNGTGKGHQGTWTDPSFLKGEKGAKGATGIQGIQGVKGDKGDAGKDVDPTTVTNLQNKDTQLQDNINTESIARTNANTSLNSRINDTNNRVNDLEKTQTIISGEIRIYDGKKITVSSFVDYTTTRQTVERAGVKVVFKMGKSAEEKEIEIINSRLNKLENSTTQQANTYVEMYSTQNGVGIREKF
jgi:hypothetical protein